MKARSLIAVGALTAGTFIATPFISHAAPGPNSGSCAAAANPVKDANGAPANSATNHSAKPASKDIDNGAAGPTLYTSGGDPGAGTSGYVGVSGTHGYLEAGGDATNPNGGYVAGNNSDSGLNGSLQPGAGICVGVAGKGGVNS